MTSTIAHSPINHFQLLCFSFFFFFQQHTFLKTLALHIMNLTLPHVEGESVKKRKKSQSVSLKFILVCDPSKILGFVANQLYPFQFVHE